MQCDGVAPAPSVTAATELQLVEKAREAQQHSYSPYSHFRVGAALLSADGRVFTGAHTILLQQKCNQSAGCNVENCSYGGAICAERTAYVKAISDGARKFTAIAIVRCVLFISNIYKTIGLATRATITFIHAACAGNSCARCAAV